MNKMPAILTFLFLALPAGLIFGQSNTTQPKITLLPEKVMQGEPMMVQVSGVTLAEIKKIYFNGRSQWFFNYQNKPTVLIGVDLNQRVGVYKILVEMENGQQFEREVSIVERKKYEAPLGIPEKLGGNTTASQQKLVSSLTDENEILNNLWSNGRKLWWNNFVTPLKEMTITDEYGYSRKTGQYSIAHKGTDFRAPEKTPVYAMNRGVVRLAREFKIYGKTIVIDHGLGLMTIYMHLSKIYVSEGALVNQDQIIGLSGSTGYAESPHLHLSVKIANKSIDPAKFMEMLGK